MTYIISLSEPFNLPSHSHLDSPPSRSCLRLFQRRVVRHRARGFVAGWIGEIRRKYIFDLRKADHRVQFPAQFRRPWNALNIPPEVLSKFDGRPARIRF